MDHPPEGAVRCNRAQNSDDASAYPDIRILPHAAIALAKSSTTSATWGTSSGMGESTTNPDDLDYQDFDDLDSSFSDWDEHMVSQSVTSPGLQSDDVTLETEQTTSTTEPSPDADEPDPFGDEIFQSLRRRRRSRTRSRSAILTDSSTLAQVKATMTDSEPHLESDDLDLLQRIA